MARIRRFSIAATLGLALLTMASPATAYIVGALTSIRAEDAADDATLEKAIRAAVDDVATHAVAFRPTMVSLREAKLVGDRIYLLVLLADQAGEKELEVFPTERRGPASVAEQSRRVQLHSHAAGYRPTFRRGREASRVPGQSAYRSIQSVCGDAADRLAPHEAADLRAARVLHERSRIAQLRRTGRAGLPFAESVCWGSGISQQAVVRTQTR